MNVKLKAWLRENHLNNEVGGTYVAMVDSPGSLTVDDIIDELKNEGMELKVETVRDVISRFNRKTTELVLSGYNVSTGLVHMQTTIKGIFLDKAWNPAVNSVHISISQSAALRRAVAETTVEILGEQANPMEILSVMDMSTGKTDGSLTRRFNAEIRGSNIKIAGDEAVCGVIFYNTQKKTSIKLDPINVVINEPSRLLVLIPESLPKTDNYELHITTQYSGNKIPLKNTRTAVFRLPINAI